ncbi:MAG: hypothetical protein BWY59_02409 [Verrucomicrobia bacterium ADurb.Bin345]|nr:MAG: hypothetical protein BWY59_02409 [Verrucomicrobia bacterium ADurb.Bin345]
MRGWIPEKTVCASLLHDTLLRARTPALVSHAPLPLETHDLSTPLVSNRLHRQLPTTVTPFAVFRRLEIWYKTGNRGQRVKEGEAHDETFCGMGSCGCVRGGGAGGDAACGDRNLCGQRRLGGGPAVHGSDGVALSDGARTGHAGGGRLDDCGGAGERHLPRAGAHAQLGRALDAERRARQIQDKRQRRALAGGAGHARQRVGVAGGGRCSS